MSEYVVSSGQTSTGIVVGSGTNVDLTVNAGGTAIDTIVNNGGTEYVSADGTAIDTIVSSGGTDYVSAGGTVSGTTVIHGVEDVYGVASGTTLSAGRQYVYLGGTASGTAVRLKATEYVSSGGTAIGTVVSAQGSEYVSSGGTAIGTVVSNGGHDAVFFSGTANFTIVSSGGGENVLSGGTASGTIVSSGGYQYVSAGGTASGTVVSGGGTQHVLGGTLNVPVGGTTISTILSGGTEFVFSGGTANSTVVGDGGNQYVYLFGSASGTVVSGGGYEYVSGTASGSIVSSGGETIVSGTVFDTIVTGGEEYVRAGGTASGTVVAGGYEYVCSAGTASGTVVSSGDEYVSGTAFGTTVDSGAVEVVYAGGTASGATVENGGTLIVDAGGMAEGIVISAGGLAVLSDGALTSGGIVLAGIGAQLEIDGTVMPGATLSGLLAATTIDLANETYSAGGQATLEANNVLQITGIGAATIDLQLDQSQDYTDTSFSLSSDGSRGTDITTATTYTWVGGYDGSYSAAVPQNWSPNGGPQPGDIIIVPDGSTLDVPSGAMIADTTINVGSSTTVTYTGVTASGNIVTLGAGVVWNIDGSSVTDDVDSFATGDTLSLNNSSVETSILTFATDDTLDLTGSTAGSMMIDPNGGGGGAQSLISQTGDGASLLINAIGPVTNSGMVWANSKGGTTTLDIQPNGSTPGTYDSQGALLVTGGTLVVESTTNSSVFANDGFVLAYGGTTPALVQITAPMATSNGQFMLVGGTAGATLELSTHTGGGQMVVFGDNDATLRIDASNILSYQSNTSVLANTKAHILDFQPGDTIDLAGLAPANLTYSYDTDTTYGSDVLELMNNGTLIGLLRFSNGVYAAGTGDVATGTFTSNFVLSADAAGTGTDITLQSATPGGGGAVDASVATWAAGATGGTADWSDASMWTGGEGSGGVPGQFQAAQITFTPAELSGLNPGDIGTEEGAEQFLVTVNSAEAAGSLVFDNPFATMEIGAVLTLATQAGESGGGFTQANGNVVIGPHGALMADRFYQVSGDFLLDGGGSITLSGQLPFAANIGLQGFEIENHGTISDGTLTALGATQIGEQDPANLQVDSGSSVTDTYTMIGGETVANTTGGASSLSISGPGTQWTDAGGDASTPYSGAMLVGGGYPGVNGSFATSVSNGGAGNLSVDQGATLTDASYAILGVTTASVGTATVSNGALWQIGTGSAPRPSGITIGASTVYNAQPEGGTIPTLTVGLGGSGSLDIESGGTVVVGGAEPWSAVVGNNAAGTLSVGGGGALFTASGAMVVGLNSSGTLIVQQGGSVSVGGELDVGGSPLGSPSDGTGQVTVSGASARLSVLGDIVVGDSTAPAGFSGLTVTNGGSLSATGTAYLGDTMQSGALVASSESGSLMLTNNAQAQFGGLAMWSDSSVTVDSSSTLVLGSTGIPIGAPGDILIGSDGVLSGGGTIGGMGTVIDNGLIEASVAGSTNLLHILAPITGSGMLEIGAGATLEVGSVANTETIVFGSGPSGTLVLTAAMLPFPVQASIQQFSPGDTIDLAGQTGQTLSWDQETGASGVLSVTNGTTTIADLDISGSYTQASFSTLSDANGGTDILTDTPPCFAAGTRVATARGEVVVERLRAGDQVRLARGGTAPVRWLGYRQVDCTRHPCPRDVMPVRVAAHAFGPGQPSGDLLLSPDHAVFIDGVLIPVRYLLNGATVVQEAASRVTYWHVELDHHDLLLAEGLACESYLDTGNRGAFANGGGATMMHANFALEVWERESCARLVWEGAELEAARSYLLDRAHELGFTITREPALHLVVGGESLWPASVAGGVWRFTLPAGADAVVIASRSAVPGEMSDVYEDGRRLGVMLARITFRQRGKPIDVALEALPDGAGFLALERDDQWCWRWTDGAAELVVPPGMAPDAPLELELHVAAVRPAWLAPTRQADAPRAGQEDGREVVAAA